MKKLSDAIIDYKQLQLKYNVSDEKLKTAIIEDLNLWSDESIDTFEFSILPVEEVIDRYKITNENLIRIINEFFVY